MPDRPPPALDTLAQIAAGLDTTAAELDALHAIAGDPALRFDAMLCRAASAALQPIRRSALARDPRPH